MDLKYFGTVAAAVFVLQFILCMKKTKLLLRLLPPVVLALGIIGCVIAAAASGSAIAAPIIGVLLAILLALDGLAWIAAWVAVKFRK